jgi:circadian clock protein KaiC
MQPIKLMPTGIPNMDEVLGGGLPIYSLNILAGQPGTGKTILSQQMLFNFARLHPDVSVLSLVTLSEPMVKVVRYMQYFTFFDAEVFGERVHYRDIGAFIREHSLSEIANQILGLVEEHRPELLVIDSFRAIHDIVNDTGLFRRFCYDLSVRLASARCTTLLVGEYDQSDIAREVEFTIADGIIYLQTLHQDGEDRRFLQLHKLRGCKAQMRPFPFRITEKGAHILSPALALRRQEPAIAEPGPRMKSGIHGLDELLRGGLPTGRAIILSGVSGTGKTTLALQFLIRGAERGERGLLFSFEESPDHLQRMAAGFGWNLQDLEERGLLRVVFIPPVSIRVEENLEQMIELCNEFKPQRFVIDSFSVFLHKIHSSVIQREKVFQITTLIRRTGVVGLLLSDIPAGETYHLSRFGVEETVVDGTIVLSTEMVKRTRRRYLEVFKMRAANHVTGRHRIEIARHGIEVLYHETPLLSQTATSPPLLFQPVSPMLYSELSHGLAWLVQGETGIGKSRLAYQFAIEGLQRGESVLFIAADVPPYQVNQAMRHFGFDPDAYLGSGQLVILDAFSGRSDTLDLGDPEALLFTIARQVAQMGRPLRKIFDSLMPQVLGYTPDEFVSLIHRKNRILRQPGVTLFDTLPYAVLEEKDLNRLLNAFDVLLDLYTPDWGEMGMVGGGSYRVMQVRKAPSSFDTRPYPYVIDQNSGIVVQDRFYHWQSDH